MSADYEMSKLPDGEISPEQFHLQVLEFLVGMYKVAYPPPTKPMFDFFQVEEVEQKIERLKLCMKGGFQDSQDYPPLHCCDDVESPDSKN
jgi:hypothetical protein